MLTLVPTLALAEGPPKLSVRIDKHVAQVAEPIRLVLEVDAPRGTRVELPQLSDQLGDFEVHGSERTKDVPAATGADARHWVLEASLETIKTGQLTIPPLDVHYTTDEKATTFKTLRSQAIPVRITSVLENRADPTKFRDIKDTVDVAVPELHSYAWLGWTAAGVGAATALALFTVAVIKRKRGPSPAEWALAAIADLEQFPLTTSADAEATHHELVDILREFFELEFNVPTLSRTTREFLAQAANEVGLDKTARERLASLSSIADEIKFARLGVGEPQVRQAIEQAKAFVNECESHRRTSKEEAA
jgi:sulfur relay (sulfurtransferase) DsrC/TusE family protein